VNPITMYANNEMFYECPVLQQLYKNKGENLVDFNYLLFAETAKNSPKKEESKTD